MDVHQTKPLKFRLKAKVKDRLFAYFLLFPSALLIFSIVTFPLVSAFFFSFTNRHTFGGPVNFIGLENYFALFNRPDFLTALVNSFIWTAGNLVLDLGIGLWVSLVLNAKFHFRGIVRALVIFPYLLPTVVAVLIWRFMLHGILGVINVWLMNLHIIDSPISWFGDPDRAMTGVILVGVWKFFPFVVISLLGILQSIPSELYEAAKIDGANTIQEFRHITLPIIMPVFIITALLRTIWTWDNFDIIFMLTQGGPGFSTTTLPILIFKEAFQQFRLGRASAIAVLTFFVVLILVIVYLRLYDKSEDK